MTEAISRRALVAALESGAVHDGVVTAGQCIGLVDDIPTCAELIERMVAECRAQLRAASRLADA